VIPFEHTGPERPAIGWARNIFVGAFLTAGAILLFPFTLLVLFLRALGYVGDTRPQSA
jgi:hypothetical protein